MIEIESFLRIDELLIPIGEVRRYDGSLDYIEGALVLTVGGVELIGRGQWDLVDQLWSYVLEGLRVVLIEHGTFRCTFPDQPVAVTMQPTERDCMMVRIAERTATSPLSELAPALFTAAQRFCDELERLIGEREVAHLREQVAGLRPVVEALRASPL